MLQSNWNLVEGAQDLAKIDYAKAPRGVCLNRAPIARVLGTSRGEGPALNVAVGETLSLFGSVHDEGLPRGKALVVSWKQLSGPGSVDVRERGRGANARHVQRARRLRARVLRQRLGASSTARVRVTVTAAR